MELLVVLVWFLLIHIMLTQSRLLSVSPWLIIELIIEPSSNNKVTFAAWWRMYLDRCPAFSFSAEVIIPVWRQDLSLGVVLVIDCFCCSSSVT
jgi:hypothetical protein